MDEPLGALDKKLREEMQLEIKRIQKELNITTISVTHDQAETLVMSDKVAVMRDGRIEQIGTPEEVVTAPATDYVAEFTKEVPRQKVLPAKSIMTDGAALEECRGEPVDADSLIEEVAARVFDQETPVPVADADGRKIGALTREAVLEVLIQRPRK